MDCDDNLVAALYSDGVFRRIMTNQPVALYEFNAVTDYLVRNNIPFDVSFDPSTRKLAAALQLTVHINPTRTEVFVVPLSPGSTAFSPSP